MKNQNYTIQYNAMQASIAAQIAILQTQLARHAEKFAKTSQPAGIIGANWGLVGDLQVIHSRLNELTEFLA